MNKQVFRLCVQIFLLYIYDIKNFFINIKRRIWNKHILLWWYRRGTSEDEFDISLSLDIKAMLVMNEKEKYKYFKNIAKRRHIAHVKDLERG